VLLPADALEWTEADVRRAMVHELEHVSRGDWMIQVAARVVCAALWFHPLVWIALRHLTLEAERACDDAVLEGAERTDYAAQLVGLARRLSNARSHSILAMANRSDLSTRVMAILDSTQRRGRVRVLPSIGVVVATVVLAAAAGPVRAVGVAAGSPAAEVQDDNPEIAPEPGKVGVRDHSGADHQQASPPRPPRRVANALARGLLEAAEEGSLDDMRELIAAGADVNGVVEGDGSPLIAAARSGRRAAVQLLLDQGADVNLIASGDGNPLIMAAREGHLEIVELLLNRGATIDLVAPGDENALIQASAAGQLRTVQLLVGRGADVNARVMVESHSRSGRQVEWRTPLSMARRGGHEEVVSFLLSVGAKE
jgi:hypothetical protein